MNSCSRSRGRGLRAPVCRPNTSGFTLIELMVAMVLGLIVIAGVGSVFLSNQQVYRSNQALSSVQDSARVAFEMMARDIRAAGLTGCGSTTRMANVLKTPTWWNNWNNVLVGYTASQSDLAAGNNRVANTESLILLGAEPSGVSVKLNAEPAGTFDINEASTNLQAGDVVVVCDPDHAALVQLSSVSGRSLTHGVTGTPGNCSKDLSYPTVCSSTSSYVFAQNALVARLSAVNWYVGNNGSGTSLYRTSLVNNAGVVLPQANEMVRDVTMLTLLYHQSGAADFKKADLITDWSQVDSVKATLTIVSNDKRAGTDAKAVSRTLTSTTTLRNRVP